jgi:hypothetical protein
MKDKISKDAGALWHVPGSLSAKELKSKVQLIEKIEKLWDEHQEAV